MGNACARASLCPLRVLVQRRGCGALGPSACRCWARPLFSQPSRPTKQAQAHEAPLASPCLPLPRTKRAAWPAMPLATNQHSSALHAVAAMLWLHAAPAVSAHLDVLHDHINVVGGLDDLIEPDDVRVHEEPQDLDLTPHCIRCRAARQRGARSGSASRRGGRAGRARGPFWPLELVPRRACRGVQGARPP